MRRVLNRLFHFVLWEVYLRLVNKGFRNVLIYYYCCWLILLWQLVGLSVGFIILVLSDDNYIFSLLVSWWSFHDNSNLLIILLIFLYYYSHLASFSLLDFLLHLWLVILKLYFLNYFRVFLKKHFYLLYFCCRLGLYDCGSGVYLLW